MEKDLSEEADDIGDLSRENVPYGIHSNGRTHGM